MYLLLIYSKYSCHLNYPSKPKELDILNKVNETHGDSWN